MPNIYDRYLPTGLLDMARDAYQKPSKLARGLLGPKQAENGVFPRPLRAGESRPNPDGSYSTEITMTERDGDMFFNFPSLYMTQEGIKQFEDPREAKDVALEYEKRSGKKFPRYSSLKAALKAAKARTNQGGVQRGALER
tara:strand:+ start:1168 stop:1587 length:420 start_codon:yes stop_codon:yes gene_type:complete